MAWRHSHTRPGFTLVELILVVGIMSLLLALLLAGIMKVRDAALRTQSANNVRQIALAVHHYAASNGDCLPALGYRLSREIRPGVLSAAQPAPALFVSILPYVEQQVPDQEGRFLVVSLYASPADPTAPQALTQKKEVASYAANARVFESDSRLSTVFGDGTSYTIMFAEHYAECGGTTFYYWRAAPSVRRPAFADSGDVVPITHGNPPLTQPEPPGWTFQVLPSPEQCYPGVPQTPHREGMLVALGDCSVRQISPGISSSTFWAAVTPRGGETLANDW